MAYPGNRDPRAPRNPEPTIEPIVPGAIERDYDDPLTYDDPGLLDNPAYVQPRDYPRESSAPRGLAGATLAVAIVLLAVIAFSFMGGADTNETAVAPEVTQPLGTDNAPTASITPDEPAPAQKPAASGEALPPIQPVDPAEPVQPAQ
jgi:type IV secretory pathway VirB10-like protein